MAEQKESAFSSTLLQIGALVAALLIVQWLSRPRDPIYPYDPTEYGYMGQQNSVQTQEPVSIYDWKPLSHIPSIDDLNLETVQNVGQQIEQLCPCSQTEKQEEKDNIQYSKYDRIGYDK